MNRGFRIRPSWVQILASPFTGCIILTVRILNFINVNHLKYNLEYCTSGTHLMDMFANLICMELTLITGTYNTFII